ncbi:MAG: transposase [Prevotellaceae bacterium]|jgi:REP element-mobilizing transposase RayT|nr:transposase [Prevotellaceae bacterium]
MTKYNPDIHHRRSIRLKGYDYSQAGMYFITICVQNRVCMLGEIINGEMQLNEYGRIAHDEWLKLSERYPNALLDVFQIMPNHMHGIIVLMEKDNASAVGAGFTPAPTGFTPAQNRATARVAPTVAARVAPTVGNIVGAYKSLVANGCLKICKSRNEYLGKLWQRNYFEHIIRNEKSYQHIADYIATNPARWESDRFF